MRIRLTRNCGVFVLTSLAMLTAVLVIFFHSSSNFYVKRVRHRFIDQPSSKSRPLLRGVNPEHISIDEEFKRDWFRLRQVRIDWKEILRPCEGRTSWGKIPPGSGMENRTSAAKSNVRSWDVRPAGQFSRLFIQSRVASGRVKRVGGDSWHVFIRGPSSVQATVFDHNNGLYEALFLLLEPGNYTAEIRLDTTYCDGLTDPPLDWFIKGSYHGRFQKEGLLGKIPEVTLLHPLKSNSTRFVVPLLPAKDRATSKITTQDIALGRKNCSLQCNFLWDGFGRWVKNRWKPYFEADPASFNWTLRPGYNRSGILLVYGDSLGYLFHDSIIKRPLCQSVFASCKCFKNWVYPHHGGSGGQERAYNDDFDFNTTKIIDPLRKELSKNEMNNTHSTLLLNAGLHLVFALRFAQYREMIDRMVELLTETVTSPEGLTVPRYRAHVIWKTTTASHQEMNKYRLTQIRFFTEQRVQLFNAYATSAMCRGGVDVLDVYELSAAYPGGGLDDAHYSDNVFESVEQFLGLIKVNYQSSRSQYPLRKSDTYPCVS